MAASLVPIYVGRAMRELGILDGLRDFGQAVARESFWLPLRRVATWCSSEEGITLWFTLLVSPITVDWYD